MPDKAEPEALASYWRQQIEAWQSSGQTQQAYCKTNELSYHRFGYWRRKFRQQSQERMLPGNACFGREVTEKTFLMDVGTAHRMRSRCVGSINVYFTNVLPIQG